MLIATFLFAAAAFKTQFHSPWLVEEREPVCTMGAVLRGGARIRIEYHPRSDSYHLLVGGGPWQGVEPGTHYKIRLSSGRRFYEFMGQGVRQPDSTDAIYLPLSDRAAQQVPRPVVGSHEFVEGLLISGKQMTIEVHNRPSISFKLGKSRQALVGVSKCSNRFISYGRSLLTARLRDRNAMSD